MAAVDRPEESGLVAVGRRGLRGRLWGGVTAAIAALSGLAPHVLHHVGPIAGAALVGGAAGTALFAVLGFALSVPFLLRLRRRFASWRPPLVALLIFGVVFTFSTLVVGPAISGEGGSPTTPAAPTTPAGHSEHH